MHYHMLPEKLSFVDIETTGASLNNSRIIEVAIIRVENGKVCDVFSSLINPEEHVPQEILDFTGIDTYELEKAPTFYDLKSEILGLLSDSVFVAHNVRFDYAFLKKEFRMHEVRFNSKQLCTVKLSRNLYPKYRRHNLDSIISRFNITVNNRHRALDDAKAIFEFYERVKDTFPEETIVKAINFNLQRPSIPLNIDQRMLDDVPETPGVYIFYGQNNIPLYIGKSVNLRRRVLSHFSGDHMLGIDMKIAQQVQNIRTIDTAGDLGALIKESQLIKQLQPLYNKKLRNSQNLALLNLRKNESGYEEAVINEAEDITYDNIKDAYGVFKGRGKAKKFLEVISKEHYLCDKLLGIEKTGESCFSHRLGICKGACVNKENPLRYNLRLYTALAGYKIRTWPFDSTIVITESNEENGIKDMLMIDKWRIIEYRSDHFHETDLPFDMDTYKILYTYLNTNKNIRNVKEL